MSEDKLYTAIDLLEKIITFTTITPNPELWKEGLLKSHPPRLLRLQQINSLAKAIFSRKPDSFLGRAKSVFVNRRIPGIKRLSSGAFLKDRNIEAYDSFTLFLKETVLAKEGKLGEIGNLNYLHLEEVYQRLLDYKKKVMELENFNSGSKMKDAVGIRFTTYITDSVSNVLRESRGDLDKALSLLVDPYTLSFAREELEVVYNYPKEDLAEIDKNFT